jgi:hypothetical protein
MRLSPLAVAVAGMPLVALASCGASPFKSTVCTEIGCRDQFQASVTSASGGVPSGTHVLEVTADGTKTTCTFTVPLAMTAAGGVLSPQCPTPLTVNIVQAQTCTTTETPTVKTQNCAPVPGQFSEQLSLDGAPVDVHVRLTVDGTVVVEQTTRPSYVAMRPNGPGCDPLCHQASETWMFASTMP